MIICPVCSFRNPDANEQCFRCSAMLTRNTEFIDKAFTKADEKTRKHLRAQRWRGPLERIQQNPWIQRINTYSESDPSDYRYPFTAGLLSILLPGLGHLYAGQATKGKLLIPVGVVFYVVAILTITQPWSNYLLTTMLLFWLYTWGSSVAVAITANGGRTVMRHVIALFFAAMFLVGTTIVIIQFLGLEFFSLQKITSANMEPAFGKGDRVLFSPLPLWYRQPRNDEVIMFDPPRFSAEYVPHTVSVNIRRYYQRLIGREGDRIRKEGNKMWRNDQLLQPHQLPFGIEVMDDFSLVVPEGKLFAPITHIPEPDFLARLHGAPAVRYYGEPGFSFRGWAGHPYIDNDIIYEVGIAVINPPERRRWLR